ncbi:MAG TPA: STAS domain-containing protein [Burkholderiaceae bacterium]|nr:STAS domain-containing protein [Burkholderiaceae bacterium]
MRAPSTLRLAQAPAVRAQGLAAIQQGAREIDLSDLNDVDSSAVAVLLAWRRAARAAGTPLALANPSTSLLSLARLYGVAELIFSNTQRQSDSTPG